MTQRGSGGGRRSRIVVDVARIQAETRGRKARRFGRAGRLLSVTGLVVVALVLVLLACGYLWWRSFERSPAYSLALLVDAAQRGDNTAVESLISADQIAQGFIPQVINRLTAADSPVPPQARPQLTSAIPQLLQHVPDSTRDEITQELKALSKGHNSFLLTALAVRSAADVREQGDKATATVKDGDRTVELSMARDGERWKVIGVKDDRVAGDIAARLAPSVPASPQPAQTQGQTRRKPGR
ncbi:MAG: hypothetical protein M3444_15260 [Acidobacteriota bacterium]|nr:hypothetical protein [Acidobacteriota bacterium]